MARKTKAEMQAEQDALQAAKEAEQTKTWPTRLMATLAQACSVLGARLSVDGDHFVVKYCTNAERDRVQELSYSYGGWESEDALNDVQWDVQEELDRRAEAARRLEVKKAALLKLTDEERHVLGLQHA